MLRIGRQPGSGCRVLDRTGIERMVRLMALLVIVSTTATVNAQASDPSSPLDPGCDAGPDEPGTPGCGGSSNSSDPGSAPSGNLPQSSVGNPISLFDGSKRQNEVDHSIPGSALVLKRVYDSANAEYNVGLGQAWRHSYSVALFDAGNGAREIVQSDGQRLRFEPAGEDEDGQTLLRGTASNHGHVVLVEDEHHWVLPDGRRLRFRGSFLVEIDWPDQRRLLLKYRERKLASVSDETGRSLRFSYSAGRRGLVGFDHEGYRPQPGMLSEVTLPDGSVIGYDYDERQNLTRVRHPDGTAREYHYEDRRWPNHLSGLTDRTGVRFATWAYDKEGRAISSEHAGGAEKVTLTYPDRRRVDSGELVETLVTNSLGDGSVFTWRKPGDDGRARLLSTSGAGCATCPRTGYAYTYDEHGRLSSSSVVAGGGAAWQHTLEYGYDANGRISEIYRIDSLGNRSLAERREYDAEHLLPARIHLPSINPQGERVREIERNERQLPVRIVERGYAPVMGMSRTDGERRSDRSPTEFRPIERATTMTYDDRGQLVAFDGPRTDVDDTTRLAWNEQSRLVAIHPPASPSLHFSRFDEQGLPVEFRHGVGTPVTLERDLSGNIASVRRAELMVRYERDAEGRLLAMIDTDGRHTGLSYDTAGRLISVTDDLGRETRRVLDDESRQTHRVTSGHDGSTIRSIETLFDAWGRISKVVTRAGEHEDSLARAIDVDWSADGLGAVVSEPVSGATTRLALDSTERLIRTSRADGTEMSTTLAATSRSVRLEDARGNVTVDPVDDFGRTVMTDSPDTGRVDFVHDAAGNRIEARYESGDSMLFEYDAAGRLVKREDADSVSRWDWDDTTGTLRSVMNGMTTERFSYDVDGRMVRHVREIDGLTFETGYDYDQRGRLIAKRLSDGQRLHYHYHDEGANRGALRSIVRERWLGLNTETVVAEVDLDSRDGEAGYLAGNGIRTQKAFAPNGEIERIEIGDTLALGYTFDDAGRIVAIEENGKERRYAYSHGRLVSANTLSGRHLYTYDSIGNRTGQMKSSLHDDPEIVRYAYPDPGEGNRLLESTDAISRTATRYRHDQSGSPTAIGEIDYTYNSGGRPTEVRRGGRLIATYVYNAFGERVKKVVHAAGRKPTTTYFLYEENAVAAEADEFGNIDVQYLYLDGHRPIARLEGDTIHAIHTDELGTPRLMTANDGSVVWQADYSPFGRAHVSTELVDLRLRLPGQYEDAETGTHYNYLRDYDPDTGRYLTADPIGLAGGKNLYAYVSGSPLNATDPLGLFPFFRPSGADSDELIDRLLAMTVDERREYVETELADFDDRSRFYSWAHEVMQTHPGATRTDWFLAASQVNRYDALGAIQIPGTGLIYDDATREYLEYAGLELGVHNLDTFLTMIGGGFVYDVCLVAPTEEERIEARSMMMVRYEQQALEAISADYFNGRPAGEQDDVYDDINSLFNRDSILDDLAMNPSNDTIEDAIQTQFTDQGIRFDIGNINHRIILGEYMVEANRVR